MRTRSATILGTLTLAAAMTACGGEPNDSGSAAPASGGSTEPPATASAKPSVAARASAEPQPSEAAGPLSLTWEEPVPFAGQPAELIADEDRWVAVGWATEGGPAAWTSTDAELWEDADVADPQPDDTFRGAGLGPTVRLGDSLLSFGTFIGCCDGRGVHGWRSADGTSWEVIESDSPLFEQGYLVRELAVGDPALVAVEIQYAEYSGRIWRWTEDTSWVEVTPGAASGEPSGIQPHDVVWSEDRFVAVGQRGDPANFDQPPVGTSWVSEDGESWEESPASAELEGVRLTAVAPLAGGGFAALGYQESPTAGEQVVPVAFTSPDGLAWSAVDTPFADTCIRLRAGIRDGQAQRFAFQLGLILHVEPDAVQRGGARADGDLEILPDAIDRVDPDLDGVPRHVSAPDALAVHEVPLVLHVVPGRPDRVGRKPGASQLLLHRAHQFVVASLRFSRTGRPGFGPYRDPRAVGHSGDLSFSHHDDDRLGWRGLCLLRQECRRHEPQHE
jgi:hypothetical protein